MNAAFKYGDLEVSIDISDYTVLEKYRTETEKYIAVMEKAPKSDWIETLKFSIIAMTNLLDAVLGENSSNKMFGTSITSLDQVMSGFEALKEYFGDQQKSRIERISKYSPKNRSQRRAAINLAK